MSPASSRPDRTNSVRLSRHFGVCLPPSGKQTPKWRKLDADDDGRAVAEEALVGRNSQLGVLNLATFSLTS